MAPSARCCGGSRRPHRTGADLSGEPELVLEHERARQAMAAEVHGRGVGAADELDEVIELAELGEVRDLAERREGLEHAVRLVLVAQRGQVVGGRDGRGDRQRRARDVGRASSRTKLTSLAPGSRLTA